MAFDLRGKAAGNLPMHPRANEVAQRAGFVRVAPPPGVAALPEVVAPAPVPEYATMMPDLATEMMLGTTSLNEVIDVQETSTAGALEEACVLYANGQVVEAANAIMKALNTPGSLGKSEFNAYRFLFDCLRYLGAQPQFDSFAMDFVTKFEKSPPDWKLNLPTKVVAVENVPVLDLGQILDASIVPVLEQLKVVAQHSKVLRLDASSIVQVDGFGCELLLRVMRAFEQAMFELEIIGVESLSKVVYKSIDRGSKATPQDYWFLYAELLILLDDEPAFEHAAMTYTITYEVSPPSWRKASERVRQADMAALLNPATQMSVDRADFVTLSGELLGDAKVTINTIAKGFDLSSVVVCDCTRLLRMEFGVAGQILTALTAWTAEGRTVEFRNVNNPIASLLVALGVHHLAVVERRRDI